MTDQLREEQEAVGDSPSSPDDALYPVEVVGGVGGGSLTLDPADDRPHDPNSAASLRKELEKRTAQLWATQVELISDHVNRAGVNPKSKLGGAIIRTFGGFDDYVGTQEQYQDLRVHMAEFLDPKVVNETGLLGDIGPDADPLEVEWWDDRRRGRA